MTGPESSLDIWCAEVSRGYSTTTGQAPGRYGHLREAIDAWSKTGRDGYIRVVDSVLHGLSDDEPYAISLNGHQLVIESEDGEMPTWVGDTIIDVGNGHLGFHGFFFKGNLTLRGSGTVSLSYSTFRGNLLIDSLDDFLSLNASSWDRFLLRHFSAAST
jgi:hypothetical protein